MKLDPLALVVVLGVLCVTGVLLVVLLNALGGVLQIVGGVMGLILNVLGSGPIGWCGCLIVVGGVCGLIWLLNFVFSALPNCGTAQATNLCRLLGY